LIEKASKGFLLLAIPNAFKQRTETLFLKSYYVILKKTTCKSKYNLNGLWIGVVLDNAIDEVKAVADYVCDTNDNDEVEKLFEEIL